MMKIFVFINLQPILDLCTHKIMADSAYFVESTLPMFLQSSVYHFILGKYVTDTSKMCM